MRTAVAFAAACLAFGLASCGTTRDQRLAIYQLTAAATGRHEVATGIGLLRPILASPTPTRAAKQPVGKIQP